MEKYPTRNPADTTRNYTAQPFTTSSPSPPPPRSVAMGIRRLASHHPALRLPHPPRSSDGLFWPPLQICALFLFRPTPRLTAALSECLRCPALVFSVASSAESAYIPSIIRLASGYHQTIIRLSSDYRPQDWMALAILASCLHYIPNSASYWLIYVLDLVLHWTALDCTALCCAVLFSSAHVPSSHDWRPSPITFFPISSFPATRPNRTTTPTVRARVPFSSSSPTLRVASFSCFPLLLRPLHPLASPHFRHLRLLFFYVFFFTGSGGGSRRWARLVLCWFCAAADADLHVHRSRCRSHRHTVTLSHCHTVTLSHCQHRHQSQRQRQHQRERERERQHQYQSTTPSSSPSLCCHTNTALPPQPQQQRAPASPLPPRA